MVDVEDEQKRDADRYTSSTETHIDSHFVTRWVTGKDPIVKKRWGRPRAVVSAEETITLPVNIFKDYDKSTQTSSFSVSVEGKTSASRWDTASGMKLLVRMLLNGMLLVVISPLMSKTCLHLGQDGV